jgi:hypothetical protein
MAVSGERLGENRPEVHMGSQKLLVDATTEKSSDRNIKLFGIHVVDQIDENLLCTSLAQIVNKEEYLFFHIFPQTQ